MSREEIGSIVSDFRKNVCDISDEEAQDVVNICIRKIEITGQPEEYMKLLLPDELKNYVFRRAVNATTLLRQMEKRCSECAASV